MLLHDAVPAAGLAALVSVARLRKREAVRSVSAALHELRVANIRKNDVEARYRAAFGIDCPHNDCPDPDTPAGDSDSPVPDLAGSPGGVVDTPAAGAGAPWGFAPVTHGAPATYSDRS